MSVEDQKIKFINECMNSIYDSCDELYEVLFDDQFNRIDPITNRIVEILKELKKTFQDEI